MLGDTAVGKTSMVMRLMNNEINEHHLSTIGIDTKQKEFAIKSKSGMEEPVKLKIWDTAGQERMHTFT